ncbi:alpha-galactosidase [uncultured Cohaesibacter sp.]|uniref:alpha-galactosidase n=1 Tax=uncultured Cohaesibacter sp. TaxID=1002546 RepID=UPI0029C83EF0|nr:alpha-galactosidase [uncultured Cohaesibacter sp.]
MSRLVTIGKGALALTLRLPQTGMPEIIAFDSAPAKGLSSPPPHGQGTSILGDIERASRTNGMDVTVSGAVLLPLGGMGFFGWPAIAGHRMGRDFILQFSDWQVEEDGHQTKLKARDAVAHMGLTITLEAFASGVISIASSLGNEGDGDYCLERCMAGSLLIAAGDVSIRGYRGMWGREFHAFSEPLGEGMWLRQSRRGRTSHDCVPTLFIDHDKSKFAVSLGWSGNHQIVIDKLDDGRRLVHAGELFEPGEVILKPGQSYQSPPLYAGADTAALHAFLREELLRWPEGKMKPRPVTLNTWEGNYFDHRLADLKDQASAAAELGIERFVLDDGWFGKRDDDTTSLGDWDIDPRKYPDGLSPLVEHVTGLGMQFGIWFEPEMVNPVSALFKARPDWALQVEGRPLLLSRNQLALDLSRKEVCDYLFEKIDAVLSNHDISYIKWDMNRDLTHVGGVDGHAVTSTQTRAVYALMDRVRSAHPGVEIESCASGGGRVDFGVLARTHRVWASDCTDALDRLDIQHGISQLLPPELIGAHVSASPNHQTGRRHSLAFRALVAMAYHFGIELNPQALSREEGQELAHYIATYKRLRGLLHKPEASFQLPPLDGRYIWGAGDESRIALFVAQGPQMMAEQPAPIFLPERITAQDGQWRISAVHPAGPAFLRISEAQKKLLAGDIQFSLADLARTGLPLPMQQPESAVMLEIEQVKGGSING